jgi:adenylate cyclase
MLHLSEYFDEMSKIIIKEHGTIDKYIGDAIMSFWGAPTVDTKHALHTCQAALFCQKKLVDLNRKWVYDKKPAFNTRIGIHTGEVIVGNLGSSERMNYTVIGDAVNLASRLEGVNKNYGTKIIISENVYKEIIEHAVIRPLDIVAVKGKREGIAIYELIALTGTDPYLLPTQEELDLCRMFQKAFKHYFEQRWDDAIEIFEKIIQRFPGDMPTQMYMHRCKHFKENPPGKDWDHIHHMKDK